MKRKIIKNIILGMLVMASLSLLTVAVKNNSRADTSDTPIPTLVGSDEGRGSVSVSGGPDINSNLTATQATLSGESIQSPWWTTNGSYNSGNLQTSDGQITDKNIQAIFQAIDLTVQGYKLTQYVASPFYFQGQLYTGYLETADGQTVPNALFGVNKNVAQYNVQNMFLILPNFGPNAPKGDGNLESGAMADFKMSAADSIQGANNWIMESDSTLSQIKFGISGHDVTLSGTTKIAGINQSYSANLTVNTDKATNLGDNSYADPIALDFVVTANSVTLGGVKATDATTISLVLNALYNLIEGQNTNNFINYSGGTSFTLSVYNMPGGANLYDSDNYGQTTWKANRVLVGVNWTTSTFYYDETDGSGNHDVPMDLDN